MAILSGLEIHRMRKIGGIQINPYAKKQLNPASYDLRLGGEYAVYKEGVLDAKKKNEVLRYTIDDEGLVLEPGKLYLMHTVERITTKSFVPVLDGKALALETDIPTPAGWRKMADLKPGDLVYGSDGHPTAILRVTKVLQKRPCYRLRFSDGTCVVSDASHEWFVYPVDAKPGIRTTAQMANRKWRPGVSLFQVPATPIHGEEVALPIPPYTLGAWLGDGTATNANITFADKGISREIQKDGYTVEPRSVRGASTTYVIGRQPRMRNKRGTYCSENGSFHASLRANGLLGDKHIPTAYKKASYEQRWALLQGLMDTDGTVHRDDQASITLTNRILFDDVEELCRSLGLVTYRDERPAKINGRAVGTAFRLTWRATPELFRLDRKRTRVRSTSRWLEEARSPKRGIRTIEAIKSVPVRCITVAAYDGLFLCTRAFIATHNSSIGRLGIMTHVTAGFGDPGFDGQYTLEVVAVRPVRVYAGMRFCQMRFHQIAGDGGWSYEKEGHYVGEASMGPVESMSWKQFQEEA